MLFTKNWKSKVINLVQKTTFFIRKVCRKFSFSAFQPELREPKLAHLEKKLCIF